MTKEQAIDFYEHLRKDDRIIGFDFQGWPVRMVTLGEMLESIGFRKADRDGEVYYEMKADSPIFDVYPSVLEDDGMGYGVNERFITDSGIGEDKNGNPYFNIFAEKEMPNKEMWYDNLIIPFTEIKFNGHNVMLKEAVNCPDYRFFVGRIYDEGAIPSSINVPEGYVKEYVDKNILKDE